MGKQYITRELRWFFDKDLPKRVAEWYEYELPGNALYSPGPRTDLYFLVKDRPDFGLKLREGKLQLKWRTFTRSFSTSDGRVRGVQATWHKDEWEFTNPKKVRKEFTRALDLKGPRYAVKKDRKQRKYSVSTNCRLRAVSIEKQPVRVAVIELTTLSVPDGTAWTLGFDVIAVQEEVDEVLQCALDKLLKDYPGPTLSKKSWAGYPKWLLRKLN